ncbi:MAG: hypothetical protein JWO83_3442 [Caulobacteraceae bacterium]|nr:hypothetical protein [Caulobacteraceae bacterium]
MQQGKGLWPWGRRGGEAKAAAGDPAGVPTPTGAMQFTPVWPDPDRGVREEVKAFWAKLGVLPPGVSGEERAAQLCVVGHVRGRLAAVSSAEIADFNPLRQRFAMFRALIAPEHRSLPAIWGLARAAHAQLEAWSLAHPEEEVMGMAAIIENPAILKLKGPPAWPMRPGDPPMSGLVLMGYTERNEQVRVSWFNHARVGGTGAA